jgi:hypothetical protein
MYKFRKLQTLIVIGLAASLSVGSGAAPAIGVVTAKGTVQLDASTVAGNGTLFEGTTVETGKAVSQLLMNSRTRMYLGTESRAKVYRDHMVLEKGDSELSGAAQYWIQARGLHIQSAESDSGARISLLGDKQVLVGATKAAVSVANSHGVLVAQVQPGRTVQLEPRETSSTPSSTLTGCLQKIDGHYILTDGMAGVTVELRGIGLEIEVGNRVEIIGVQDPGVAPGPLASQVINTSSIRQVARNCSSMGVPGAAPSAARVGAGISTHAIVAGVVVAGATTGAVLGVRAATSSSNTSKPSISQ